MPKPSARLLLLFWIHYSVDVASGTGFGNNLARIPNYNRSFRYVEVYKSSGSYESVIANRHLSDNDCMCSYPDAIPNGWSAHSFSAALGSDRYSMPDVDIGTEGCVRGDYHSPEVTQIEARTNFGQRRYIETIAEFVAAPENPIVYVWQKSPSPSPVECDFSQIESESEPGNAEIADDEIEPSGVSAITIEVSP